MRRGLIYCITAIVCIGVGTLGVGTTYNLCQGIFTRDNIMGLLFKEETRDAGFKEDDVEVETLLEAKEKEECKRVSESIDGRVIWVGDSRTVQLQNVINWFPDVSEGYEDVFICQGGMGYQYFVNTCIPEVNAILQEDDVIVMNMGVNDLGNIEYYISIMNELMENEWKDHTVIYMTPNPVLDSASKVQNKDIEAFNSRLEQGLCEGIQYLDSYTLLRNYEYTDSEMDEEGVHYSAASKDGRYHTYEYIYNLVRTQQRGKMVCETVGGETNSENGSYFSGKVEVFSNWTNMPVCETISEVKICTPARAITRTTSEQYKLLFQNAYGNCQVDELGFYYVSGVDPDTNETVKYYCIALGGYYEQAIGERFRFRLSNGETVYAITSDIRQDQHSQAGNNSANISDSRAGLCVGTVNEVMEFYIDTDIMKVNLPLYTGYAYTGGFNQNYDSEHMFQGSIVSVDKLLV